MEIQKSILTVTGYLQAPFEVLCAELFESYTPGNYTQFFLKVLNLALAIIWCPAFGTTYLLGRAIEWLVALTVEEGPMREEAPSSAIKAHAENFTKIQETTNALLKSRASHKEGSIALPKKEVLEVMKEAYLKRYQVEELPPGVKVLKAGNHFCFFYDKTPDVIYKTSDFNLSRSQAEEYVDQADRARALCQKLNLFLLFVPKSCAVMLSDNEYIIVQEKANTDAHFYNQRGIFRRLLQSPESKEYVKEVHRQLAIFIAKFKFSDVKYNNYPITDEGYVALFDLDEKGAVKGFLSGCADAEDGLLSDLPAEMQREVVDAAKPYLAPFEIKEIEESMEAKKALSAKRWKKVHDYYQYAQKQEIKTPEQKLSIKAEQLLDLSAAERSLALALIERINENNAEHKNWVSLRTARMNFICTYSGSIYKDHSLFFRSDMPQALKRVAKHLKKIGAIFSYKLTDQDLYLKVQS